jgi:outer membrane protein insertion porin family
VTLRNSICAAAFLGVLRTADCAAPKPADVDTTINNLHVRTEGVSKDANPDVKDVIEEQIALTEDTIVSAPLADDLAFFVRQRYLDLGYFDAKVDWEITGDAVVLRMEEGPRYTVGTVRFEGNTSMPEDEMTRYLLRRTHEKLDSTSDHPPFVEADLRDGAGLVKRYLLGQGYLDAVVADPIFTPHPESGTQDVLVKIKEGRRYQFGEIHVTGDLLGREAEVEEQIKGLRDQPFNEVKMDDVRKSLSSVYETRGYYTAAVTAETGRANARDGSIPVTYHVMAGPQFRIAALEISPELSKGAQRIARSGFKRGVGKVFSPAELDVMNRQVLESEIFARLDVDPKPIGEDELVLEISGEEAKTRRYSAYAGYETFRGPVLGVESRKVNFHDTGSTLRLKAEANGVGFNGGITWIDPAVFNSPYKLEAELGGDTEAVFDYERRSYFGRLQFSRQWDRHISAKLFTIASLNSSEADKLTPEELGPDDYQIESLGASAVFDYRDNPLSPVDGWFTSITVTGMFGDINYVRTDAVFSVYQPLTKKLRVAASAKASLLATSLDVTEVPIDLRVFNGGANSVRSFEEREMGQKARRTPTPLGGLYADVATIELSYEVKPNLELALFGDVGSIRPTDDFESVKLPELRYAVGLGIRYKLPIGPLRVDYGWNPDRRKGEPFGALHITFGFAF